MRSFLAAALTLVAGIFIGNALFSIARARVPMRALVASSTPNPRDVKITPPPVDGDRPASPKPARRLGQRRQFVLKAQGTELALSDVDGRTVLRIPAVLRLRHDDSSERLQARWTLEGDGVFIARGRTRAAHAIFRAKAHASDPRIQLSVEIHYDRDLQVRAETWTFHPQDVTGTVLDRGLRPLSLDDKSVFVDRFTPFVARFRSVDGPAFGFLDTGAIQGIWARTDALVFELDHAKNHPHSIYQECFETYARHHVRTSRARRRRRRGDVARYALTFAVGDVRMPVLERWPDGRKAALAIVDHADQTTTKTLRAVLYGASDAGPNSGRGALGHGVAYTQTVFDTRAQLGRPRFAKLLRALTEAGGEVAPHSVTPRRDRPRRIIAALARPFRPFSPITWVDHQPDTNCEAINNQGGDVESAHFLVPTLLDAGLRYFWEAPDFRGWRGLNLFRPHRVHLRVAPIYPGASLTTKDGRTPWLFRSAWMYLPRKKVLPRFAPARLDALEAAQGLHIAHTYFGKLESPGDDGGAPTDDKAVLERTPDGRVRLRDEVDAIFARLGNRHEAGTLWVTPVGPLGDWLRGYDQMRLVVRGDHTVRLDHPPNAPSLVQARRWTVRATDGGTINGVPRARVAGGDVVEVSPPIFDATLGVHSIDPRLARAP